MLYISSSCKRLLQQNNRGIDGMMFQIRTEENILALTKNRKRHKRDLIILTVFILIFYCICVYTLLDARGINYFMVPLLFVHLFFIPQMRDLIRVILHGEVLCFDKDKGEFLINSLCQKRIDEISGIEIYHRSGDDVDMTYLDIIYTDGTYYRLDQVSIYDNEDLVEAAKLIGGFLNVEVVERQHQKKWII
ncbi:hypothetical protein D770_25775 [Flammeovirgaceae bacterium 311]|nr:hypothetical protein D770_25775 [Flammeovirgaceae bacterium 311]